MGRLRWLSTEGDSEIRFGTSFIDNYKAAKQFKKLKKEYYLAFERAVEGADLTPSKRFDKNAHEIWMIPQIAGG